MSGEQHHPQSVSSLFSVETGPESQPLVVLIHGSLDRSGGMALLARHVQHSHRVLRYDRRGYGKSWPHEGPFDVEDQVKDLVGLIGNRSVVLLGHSYGGNVALAAAEILKDQVRGVSTYETPLSWMTWWPGTTAGAMAVSSTASEAAEKFMVRLIGQSRWNSLPDRTRQERRQEGVALIGELTALRLHEPWRAEAVTCRVLSGFGSEGLAHHADGARWIADHIANARLVELHGAAHGAPLSHPEMMVDLLIRPHLEG